MRREMGEDRGVSEEQKRHTTQEGCTGESNLRKAIQRISSLISLSHSIKVFPVKWQLIRKKLEELNSGLTAAEKCDLGENSKFSELIPSIEMTLNDCNDLARRCVDLSYSGKLLMQSDLDMICVKFQLNIKNLAGIYTAGILTNALVVSKPGIGACRDDMKFYVRDLLTRLKIGDFEMKSHALVALNEVVSEDEKCVRIVIETGEIISLLVNFLEFPEIGIQEESAKAISVVAGFDTCRNLLVGAGIIAPLIRVLEGGTDLGKERAARALQKLTENSENAWSVSAQGGVTALLKLCTSGNEKGGEFVVPACGVLRNLAGVEEIKRFMVEEGAVSCFITLVRSKDEASQISGIELLQIIASRDESVRQMIIRGGGIQILVRVMDPKSSFSSKARETALRAIESLCFSSMSSLNILINCGFLDQLLYILRNGFMPEFVRLLDMKSFEFREMAAEVLCNMVCIPRNRKRFMQENTNVEQILQLLDPEEVKSGNKFLLSILMSLTSCNSARRKIMKSGYVKNLEKLAEAEDIEAKKILRKLSTNRFRSILSGIWSS
ncbi:vacuolar protein 8-like isoform X2 [Macadamia integrifolia]|uniref:vacuolar protein 8-like isoform X2 n=1 Tax=Macadamia integrifolia TaxID=60698 RepID=UPI001C52EEB9|nr:vacuolar protein 8-like isoform X2 [Macadamia integrifolia]